MSGETGGQADSIVKTMSMTEREFEAGCQRLAAPGDCVGGQAAKVAVATGLAHIRYEPLEGVTLGGLLKLPRARVTISFENVTRKDQAAFVRRFDVAFQRGGG